MSSWTASDLAALERAIATGARVVEYDTVKTEYRSMKEMLALRDMMRVEVGGSAPRVTHIQPTYSRGV